MGGLSENLFGSNILFILTLLNLQGFDVLSPLPLDLQLVEAALALC